MDTVPKGCYTGPDTTVGTDSSVAVAVIYNSHGTGGTNAADRPLCMSTQKCTDSAFNDNAKCAAAGKGPSPPAALDAAPHHGICASPPIGSG